MLFFPEYSLLYILLFIFLLYYHFHCKQIGDGKIGEEDKWALDSIHLF